MRADDWISAHIFYNDALDPLLTRVVAPLTADGPVRRYFFIRYWDGGIHLRLRLDVDETDRDRVRRWLVARCERFFAERPSPALSDPGAYATVAARLAAAEGIVDYRREPHPTDAVAFLPYVREHDRYGGYGMAAVEEHFARSSRIALDLVTAGLDHRQRDTAAFCLVTLARLSIPALAGGGPTDGSPPGRRSYDDQRDALRRLAARMRAYVNDGVDRSDGALPAWTREVRDLHARLGSSPHALAVVDDCVHLMCNRLGVTPAQEGRLRYLSARTLRDL